MSNLSDSAKLSQDDSSVNPTITDEMRRAAPDALYPCETYGCAEERTYPADELHWHPRHECFYCEGCHSGEHEKGDPRWGDAECPTLAQVLRAP